MRTTGLYAIVDLDTLARRELSARDFAQRLLAARPVMLQVRAKLAGARKTLELLRALVAPCRAAGTLLVANDRPDLALLAEADGVHVGQADLSIGDVRAFAPELKVGVSTHDLAQLERALAERPDYAAFGPVFPTSSKPDPDPVVGLTGLARARELALRAGVPLVAIGGIDLDRAPSIAELGAIGAVIGALLPDGTDLSAVSERARALSRALEGG